MREAPPPAGGPRPLVVSKYIPLPWRLFEPRSMMAALRASGVWGPGLGRARRRAAAAGAGRVPLAQPLLCSVHAGVWLASRPLAALPSPYLAHRPSMLAVGRLQVESLDGYLVHSPVATLNSIRTLASSLATAVESGLTRTVGVSNYSGAVRCGREGAAGSEGSAVAHWGCAAGCSSLPAFAGHRGMRPRELCVRSCCLPAEAQLRETHRVLAERGIPLAVNQVGPGVGAGGWGWGVPEQVSIVAM